jgi:twitching motility protein PilT
MSSPPVDELLSLMIERRASDLHLKAGRPPLLRIERELFPLEQDALRPEDVQALLSPLLNERQRHHLDEHLWVDLGYMLRDQARFRVSITHQRGSLLATFRHVPLEFPSLDEWELPEVLKEFAALDNGLVLITGPAGSGKSSTLAALLRLISETRRAHVVTIEDPIEFIIHDAMGSVSQREVGSDAREFADALRSVLRQDPDVIAIGEMRDLETMSTALSAAETGHIVFSTLHTISAAETIDRMVDGFPPRQQEQVRAQLARVLRGIVSLRLVPRAKQEGLIAAVEVLKNTPRISKLIATAAISEIEHEIEDSVMFVKMQSMNQSLMALALNGVITPEAAASTASNPDDFDREMRKNVLSLQDQNNGGSPMSDSPADYSKIAELQEVKRLYEDSEERHASELAEQKRIIEELKEALGEREARITATNQELSELQQKKKNELMERDQKIGELRLRIKELSSPKSPRGFFAREKN